MLPRTLLLSSVIVSGLVGPAPLMQAQENPSKLSQMKTLSTEEIKLAEIANLPSPALLFAALDAAKGIDWGAIAAEIERDPALAKADYDGDAAKALNAGIRIADAFIAIQARNAKLLEAASETAIKLSQPFGISDELKGKGEAISTLAKAEKWPEVRAAVQDLSDTLESELQESGNLDAAKLASIGGWLRGLQLASQAVAADYNEPSGALLRQGELAANLIGQLEKLDDSVKSTKEVKIILEKGPVLQRLTTTGKGTPLTKEQVSQTAAVSAEVIAIIVK